MFAKLNPYLRPARRHLTAGALVLLAGVAVELLLPWPVKWLVDYVFHPGTGAARYLECVPQGWSWRFCIEVPS
jgi:hypothetical protein